MTTLATRTTGAMAARPPIDSITLEIIRHQLAAIPNQIERNIERTAFSPLVYEYKDYSVGFVDPVGRLVVQSRGSLPIFVANALGTAVREGLEVLGPDHIHDGDIVVTNNPAWLGQHLNNVVAYTPVRIEGELIGFFAVLVHWVDVGGSVPGSCVASNTTDVWQEGLQLPTLKLLERGRKRPELFRLIAANTRFPAFLLGDVEAQIAGCQTGHDLVQEITARHGLEAVKAAIVAMWDGADHAVKAALARARPGTYIARAELDDDGVTPGRRVPVDISVTLSAEEILVDLSGLGPQTAGPFNAGRNGGAIAAARIACKYMFSPDTPVNDGDFRRLRVEIPDGRFLSASPDAAIGHSGSTVPTVVDAILNAFGQALPERAAAAHHGIYGIHAFDGRNPETGERFQHLDTVTGGWGATAVADGPSPYRSNGHGDVPDVPVEMQESFFPYRIEAKRLRPDSGGVGRHRGGLGVEKVYRILGDCRLVVGFDRVACPPWGVHGGGAGLPASVEILRANGTRESFSKGERRLSAGDFAYVRSGGGGGFGPAVERAVEDVLRDVRLGYVSREGAERDYGVVLSDDGIDEAATAARRKTMSIR